MIELMPIDKPSEDVLLTVTTAEGGAWAIVSVRGEIDVSTASSLEDALRACVASSGKVIIDLSGVRFMDSTGLGMMVRARKLAQREQEKLNFTNLQPAVQNVVHLARLEHFLLPARERELAAN